ncbi:MAG TPA: prepilin-type N-terminal cleavage/methylation domain-containing protein [Methylomirabilota bacterium]|jgi:prepilin-type N-terminal cleavage/methylation domain-containing protein|nr:prepilin-type N-terminal cleavage/methylation domain-containing protein [Methylomirabilota bacterium]
MNKCNTNNRKRRGQQGFTLIELMIAIVVLVVGVVSVAQLVPAAIFLNSRNRFDSSSLVYAQREMDQFVNQAFIPAPYTFTDQQGNPNCNVGGGTVFDAVVGSPVTTVGGHVAINFTGGQVAGYSYKYTDPTDPTTNYDVRWAVISTGTANNIYSRRFIMGVQKSGGDTPLPPVTLDTTVSR